MAQAVVTEQQLWFMVYLMNHDESRAWFLKPVRGTDERDAISKARVKTIRPEFKIRALVRRSAEAKAAHKKISGRIPGHVYTSF